MHQANWHSVCSSGYRTKQLSENEKHSDGLSEALCNFCVLVLKMRLSIFNLHSVCNPSLPVFCTQNIF